jgi:hypothetical protein
MNQSERYLLVKTTKDRMEDLGVERETLIGRTHFLYYQPAFLRLRYCFCFEPRSELI